MSVTLDRFMSRGQLKQLIMLSVKSEEAEYFRGMIAELRKLIETMPETYGQDGKGDEAIVYLHYFNGGSDWWITEKDAGSADDEVPRMQDQAFGFVCLNGDIDNAELGYISIQELIENGIELDLYWKPKTLKDVKAEARI